MSNIEHGMSNVELPWARRASGNTPPLADAHTECYLFLVLTGCVWNRGSFAQNDNLTSHLYETMTKAGSKRKKVAVSNAPEEHAMDETPENLDKVRDILFGGQMRAVDQRLASLEARFQRDLKGLRTDTGKQLSDLEAFFKKEIESQTEKLQAERSKRSDDLKRLSAEVKDGFKNLEKRLGKLDDTTSKADADLRTAILEHTKTVTAQLKKVSDEFSSELQQAVMELRGEKLDTATLIQLFSDMALHLTEDLQAGPEND